MNKKLFIFLCTIAAVCLASEPAVSIGYFSAANGKPQEDTFSYNSINGRGFYGVYDGHGGAATAQLLEKNLHTYFAPHIKTVTKKEAFEAAFNQAEKCAFENVRSGSTAVASYIGKKNIHIAWVGDSRAMVVKNNGENCFVTCDHDLKNNDEYDRVIAAKGEIFRLTTKDGSIAGEWRINGLEMTRSIGDRKPKGKDFEDQFQVWRQPYGKINGVPIFVQLLCPLEMAPDIWKVKPLEGQVIANPEYAKIPLAQENHWLVLATDGLWKVITNEQVSSFVAKKAHENSSLKNIAQLLVEMAIARGGNDNITVLVIDLLFGKNK
jgi:serine/threonine protein phosphatase PrpC